MRIAVILCALSLAVSAAEGSVAPALGKGMQEVSVQGFWSPEGAMGMELDITGSYGIFLADELEVGGLLSYAYYEDSVSGLGMDTRMWYIGGFFEYHIDFGMLTVPYAGLEAGYARYSISGFPSGGAIVYGPKLGMKYFLSDKVALDFAVKFRMANDDIFVRKGEARSSDIYAVFGVRALF